MEKKTDLDVKALEIKNRYSRHKIDREAEDRMRTVRRHICDVAYVIQMLCPDNGFKLNALSHLDNVMTCANSSIAQPYPQDTEE